MACSAVWPSKARRLAGWIGRQVEVLVDGADDDGRLRCRHHGQAPEVDSVTLVGGVAASPGDPLWVRVMGVEGYDLLAEPA